MPLYGEAIVVTNFKRLMLSTRLVILLLFFASFLLSLVTAMFLQLGCKNSVLHIKIQLYLESYYNLRPVTSKNSILSTPFVFQTPDTLPVK